MLANKLDAREFLCQIGLIVYGNIAAVLAARCNLTLGNWDRDESWAMPNDAYTLVRGHTEPFLHHVLSDPSAVLGASYEAVLEYEPYVDHKECTLVLRPARSNTRKSSGSYYTPESLVEQVLEMTLLPALQDRSRDNSTAGIRDSLMSIRVCDPACGAGRFLVPAARMIANSMACIANDATRLSIHNTQKPIRTVVLNCIYGVDLDPIAVLLCRIALWLEINDVDVSLESLEANIRVGNALLGANPNMLKPSNSDGLSKQPQGAPTTTQLHDIDVTTRLRADAWCASIIQNEDAAGVITGFDEISSSETRQIFSQKQLGEINRLARLHRFFHWHIEFPSVFKQKEAGFDVIVGNPPFQNQLDARTATDPSIARLHRIISGGVATRYSDIAARFLARAMTLCGQNGRVGFVLPLSVLSTTDAIPIRQYVARTGTLTSIWISTEHVFRDASVYTCALTIARGGPRHSVVQRTVNDSTRLLAPIEVDHDSLAESETWAPLIACAIGIPEFEYESNGTVGNLAAATADFRDQYYGLDGFLVESEEISECDRLDSHFPPIVTSGMIDLAECRWGAAPAKLLKQTWHAPRIDRSAMKENGTLDPWISQRLIPKILLATQTRIIEVFVDDKGRFVPSTPLISVMPKERDAIWRIASALASPVASALAMQRYAGSALSTQAIKLSAKQSLRLPIPVDEALWKQAASMLQEAHEANSSLRRSVLESFAGLIVSAYRVPQDQASPLLQWWLGRLK